MGRYTPQYFRKLTDQAGAAAARVLRATYRFLKRTPNWKLAGGVLLAGCLLVFVTLGFIYLRARGGAYGPMPDHTDLALVENSEASSVISEDGEVIGKYFRENRVSVDLADISPFVTDALIATEDARFFEHQGIDLRALGRVLVKSIALGDRSSGGGSTISQQLAKQLYPRQYNGTLSILKTKVREMIIASRLEEVYSKEDLLALYLNTVPFGENAYGIEVASNRFFSKSANELKAEEAAVLVGLLKANTTYSPRAHPERSRERRDVVLALMARNGSLSEQATDSLRTLELVTDYRRGNLETGSAPHFRSLLRREVEQALVGKVHPDRRPYDVDRDGLRIHVSINSHLQRFAEQAVAEELPKIQANLARDWKGYKNLPWQKALDQQVKKSNRYQSLTARGLDNKAAREAMGKEISMVVYDSDAGTQVQRMMSPLDSINHYFTLLNAGLLVTQSRDGVVRAWVSGVDFNSVQYDHVTAKRQVGSTIKPVVYATALQQGIQPCEYTPAEQFTLADFQDYNPRNPGGNYEGVYSMRGGLAKSVNTVAVNLAVRSGLGELADQVKSMGIEGRVDPIPSLALGTVEASLPEMNTVYSAFPNGGARPEGIHFLDKITDVRGNVIVEFKRPTATKQVLDERTAGIATYLMAGVINSGTGAKLRGTYGLTGPIAGKTGTTQNQSDGWFVGFTPKLVVSTWVGAEYPSVHFRTLSRGSATATALPIWGNFMRRVERANNIKFYKGGSWGELDEMTVAELACPDYLEEMPVLIADVDNGEEPLAANEASAILGQYSAQEIEDMMRRKRRQNRETTREYAIRIARYIQRERDKDAKRKERKEFWVKRLFGGGN